MAQLHKRFSDEQLRVLFRGYCQGQFSRADLQEMLDIGNQSNNPGFINPNTLFCEDVQENR